MKTDDKHSGCLNTAAAGATAPAAGVTTAAATAKAEMAATAAAVKKNKGLGVTAAAAVAAAIADSAALDPNDKTNVLCLLFVLLRWLSRGGSQLCAGAARCGARPPSVCPQRP